MSGKAVLVCVSMLLTTVSSTSFAFESDVHFGLTRWLAMQAGYAEPQAEAIATGDQRVDSGDMQFVELALAAACAGRDDESARHLQQLHFPSAGRIPGLPEERAVVPGSDVAKQAAVAMTKVAPGQAGFLLGKLGEALHPLQDSWSHQGVSDVPNFPGGAMTCDATRIWAHAKARGGWNSHKADLTMNWPADTLAMAQASYEILVSYPSISGVRRTPKDWRAIAPALDGFIRASTKTDKKRWFMAQGIADVSFLQGISLADGTEPFELEWQRRRLPPLTTSNSAQHHVEPELLDFYSRFFSQWASTDRLDAVAAEFGAGVRPLDRTTKAAIPALGQAQLTGLLKVWRLHDHGSVAEIAHANGRLSERQLAMINALAKKPRAYASYATPEQAFYPLLAKGPEASPLLPFVIGQLPPAPTGNARAIAMAKFRHAPYDTVGAISEKIDGHWRLIDIVSTVEH